MKHGDNDAVKRFANREKVKYLEEFYLIEYAKLDYYDRYMNYSDETGEDEETTVLHVNLDMDKEAYVDATLVSDFSLDMIINKHRYLAEDFEPEDLVKINEKYANGDLYASRISINAFVEMYNAALKEGYEIVINSAYRSYQDQQDIVNTYLNLYGQKYVNNYVAKPGFSEHQTGLAFDIGSKKVNVFANSEEYKWMLDNSYKYGFINRFPKKYENITEEDRNMYCCPPAKDRVLDNVQEAYDILCNIGFCGSGNVKILSDREVLGPINNVMAK